MTSLLKIGAALASIVETVTSWLRSRADQKIGRELQQRDDLTATVKEATDGQAIADNVRRLSDAELDRRLQS